MNGFPWHHLDGDGNNDNPWYNPEQRAEEERQYKIARAKIEEDNRKADDLARKLRCKRAEYVTKERTKLYSEVAKKEKTILEISDYKFNRK